MKLKDALPNDFMESEYKNCKARKFANVEVIKEYDSRDKRWIGKHKNITYWYELKNGYAVGINENPSRGLNFLVERIKI